MKVKVTLLNGANAPDHIQITATATATVGEVAHSLAHSDRRRGQLPTGRDLTLRVHSAHGSSTTLPRERTLIESGIQSGSSVEIAFAEEAETQVQRAAAALLRVLSGPDAGREFPLPAGSSSIGRSPSNVVVLNDPRISKKHARINVGSRIELIDAGSSNGVEVGGQRVTRTVLASGDVAELGDTEIAVVRVGQTEENLTSTDVDYVRPPRVLGRPVDTTIDLPEVPRAPQLSPFPWLALAAPLLMGSVMLFVARGSTTTDGAAKYLPIMFIALSPLLLVGSWFQQRSQRKRSYLEDVVAFESDIDAADRALELGHITERAQLLALHPSVAECRDSVARIGGVLWTRRPEHPEFLQVRLGLGDITPFHRPSTLRAGGAQEYHDRATALAADYASLTGGPVVADIRSTGGLGFCGDPSAVEGVIRAAIVQLVTLHSPSEVAVVCLTSREGQQRWDWLTWVPHTSSPHSPLPGFHLSADPGTGKVLLNQLEEIIEVRARGQQPAHRGPLDRGDDADAPTVPSIVVIVDEANVDLARLNRVAERGADVGVYLIWTAPSLSGLPGACRTYVEVVGGTARVGMVRRGTTDHDVVYESLDREAAAVLARTLSPVVDAGCPVEDDSDLPRSVSVVSLFGHEASDDPAVVLARWRENESLVPRDGSPPVEREKDGDLRAIVGSSGADPFTIDLRTQGPHALVGGTTGAGKSEFLQAWVLGLAHAYSPDRVTFLFVDYKGGAAFAKCLDLPHCVGLVTDLSPYLVRRALKSLRAELHYRERLLNAKGKKDLLELEKTGDPECPPSLIIVIDEFAALVGEVPEFVDGVVDVAQRGRSLGLHLILATQRPAGVIKDNLRANTNLRIALRMADEHDSQDVLGDQMAAHFSASIPGRAAAKTGPGRITQFQSGFPGARTPQRAVTTPIDVVDLDFGHNQFWKLPEPPRATEQVAKDIDRVVTAVAAAARLALVPEPRRPWLASLAPSYNLAKFSLRRDTRLPLGIVDDPDRQAQSHEYYVPDDEGNILFVGAGGSGKSTALRSLAVACAVTPGGGLAHVYGIDAAGGQLTSLETLPNVGSIVQGDDDERVRRLINDLATLVEERSERYSAIAASTLREYRSLDDRPLEPRIVLLLDGFSNFKNAYESSVSHSRMYAQFQRLLVDGRAVGVHVAMTADRPSTVPNSIMSAFGRRIVLRLADDDAYMAMGVARDVLTPTSPPGRAVQVDRPQELQLAVFLTEAHAEQNNTSSAAQLVAIEELAKSIGRHHTRPQPVRALTSLVLSGDVPSSVGARPTLGISDVALEPVGFDPTGIVMVAGPAQSGRTNAVRWLAESLHRVHADTPLIHLSARRTPLSQLDLWTDSTASEQDVATLLGDLQQIAGEQSPVGMPLLALFIEFLPEFIGTSVEQQLMATLTLCRRNGHFVVAEGESPSWGSPWPLVMEVKNTRSGLLLQPDQQDGDVLFRTSLPRVKRADFPPGRGFWIKGGKAEKVQIPLVEEWVDRPMDDAGSRAQSDPVLTDNTPQEAM